MGGDPTANPNTGMQNPPAIFGILALNHHLIENGGIFNMKFNPDTGKFIEVVKTYFDLGGFQTRFTVVNKWTLLDAPKDPERHRDPVVRVAGSSTYIIGQCLLRPGTHHRTDQTLPAAYADHKLW